MLVYKILPIKDTGLKQICVLVSVFCNNPLKFNKELYLFQEFYLEMFKQVLISQLHSKCFFFSFSLDNRPICGSGDYRSTSGLLQRANQGG